MLDGSWQVAGFVPPLFDAAARDAFWPAGERRLAELDPRAARAACGTGSPRAAHRARRPARSPWRRARRAACAASRSARRAPRCPRSVRCDRSHGGNGRAACARSGEPRRCRRAAPAAGAARDRARRDHRAARRAGPRAGRAENQRLELSRALMKRLHDGYVITNFRGERRPLRALFAPGEPPSGAGDCAGAKLLATPIASGLRRSRSPSCGGARRRRAAAAAPVSSIRRAAASAARCCRSCSTGCRTPPRRSSAPGRSPPTSRAWCSRTPGSPSSTSRAVCSRSRAASRGPGRLGPHPAARALARRRRRSPPRPRHRPDCSSRPRTLRPTPRCRARSSRREVDKRYIAWLDGSVAGDRGTIELALRVDLDDRPRQIVDPVHGKPAITEWRVIERSAGRTRVELVPRTGRSHQLRVHRRAFRSASPRRSSANRLYGRAAARLALHAEALAFVHPHTGRRIALERPAPF